MIKHISKLGANVIGVNRKGKTVEGCSKVITFDKIDEVLPLADFLYLAVPGTAARSCSTGSCTGGGAASTASTMEVGSSVALRSAEHASSGASGSARQHALPPSHLRAPAVAFVCVGSKKAPHSCRWHTRRGDGMCAHAVPWPRPTVHGPPLRPQPTPQS